MHQRTDQWGLHSCGRSRGTETANVEGRQADLFEAGRVNWLLWLHFDNIVQRDSPEEVRIKQEVPDEHFAGYLMSDHADFELVAFSVINNFNFGRSEQAETIVCIAEQLPNCRLKSEWALILRVPELNKHFPGEGGELQAVNQQVHPMYRDRSAIRGFRQDEWGRIFQQQHTYLCYNNSGVFDKLTQLPGYPRPSTNYVFKLGYIPYPEWSYSCRISHTHNLLAVTDYILFASEYNIVLIMICVAVPCLAVFALLFRLCFMARHVIHLKKKMMYNAVFLTDD